MIISLTIIILTFYWLMRETKGLTIRLQVGIDKPIILKYARYKVYNYLKNRKPKYDDTISYSGDNYPEGYSPNGEPEYSVILSPGVDGVLCGWDWLNGHCADMVDYEPQVFMAIGNIRYDMKIKQPKVIKDVMRINRLTKKQVRALAY